jgi:hypothetical protein
MATKWQRRLLGCKPSAALGLHETSTLNFQFGPLELLMFTQTGLEIRGTLSFGPVKIYIRTNFRVPVLPWESCQLST